MNQIRRKIGSYQGHFQLRGSSLVINLTSSLKSVVLFARLTDQRFPEHLKHISQNTRELFQLINQTLDQKIAVNQKQKLILMVESGKKVKEYVIDLERAQLSAEESLKTRVIQLQTQLSKTQQLLSFYKQQYHFLLSQLHIKPNNQQLAKRYSIDMNQSSIQEINMSKANSCKDNQTNKLTQSSLSVRSANSFEQKWMKCFRNHDVKLDVAWRTGRRCDICKISMTNKDIVYQCKFCDFDLCTACSKIQNKRCPKLHPLIFGCAPIYITRRCDLCRTSLKDIQGFTCLLCDYDVCHKCM